MSISGEKVDFLINLSRKSDMLSIMKYVPQMKDPKFKFYKLMQDNRERYDSLTKEVMAPKK